MSTVTAQMPEALAVNGTSFSVPMTLASVNFTVDFTWDNRATDNAGAWRVTWRRANGEPIFNQKLVLTDDFFKSFHYLEDIPTGRLQVRRADNTFADPGLLDLAGAVLFEYITE